MQKHFFIFINDASGHEIIKSRAQGMEVSSEILPFFQRDPQSRPKINDKYVISKFPFVLPPSTGRAEKDADGDYLVERRGEKGKEVFIVLEHGVSTELKLVGLQIWRGALLLSDFLIHSRHEIENETVLELGAGVGLTSILGGMYAKQIICTDVDRGDILNLLRSNIERNKELVKNQTFVEEIDFFNREWPPELTTKLEEVSVIIAADVIYDNDVTEAFMKTITKLLSLPPKKKLYLAMEKRYVFTLADLDSVAPCYEYLLKCLEEAKRVKPSSDWRIEEIDLDFPQYFNYERVKELILLKISVP